MTYLEIVNDVLKRLRETTVSAVDENEYSAMIGVLVNDAKRDVENAHQWNVLRTATSITTVVGTQEYTLTGLGNRFVVDRLINNQNGGEIDKAPIGWLETQTVMHPDNGLVAFYAFSGQSAGDSKIKFFKVPDAVETYTLYAYVPQADLTSSSTDVLVPGYLVAHSAYARAIAERGEDSGDMSSEAQGIYKKALADAIAIERNRHEEEINWEAV
jgi:hypothetical protein